MKTKSIVSVLFFAIILISSVFSVGCKGNLNASEIYTTINALTSGFEPGFVGFGAEVSYDEIILSSFISGNCVKIKVSSDSMVVCEESKSLVSEYHETITTQKDFIVPANLPEIESDGGYLVYCAYTGTLGVNALDQELRNYNAALNTVVYRTDEDDDAPVFSAKLDEIEFLNYVSDIARATEDSAPNAYKVICNSGLFTESQANFIAKREYLRTNGCNRIGIAVFCRGGYLDALSSNYTVTAVKKL